MSADIIDFDERQLRRLALAYKVTALPKHVQDAVLRLLRLYIERQASPSAQIDATIERVEAALRDGRVHELDPPESLLLH